MLGPPAPQANEVLVRQHHDECSKWFDEQCSDARLLYFMTGQEYTKLMRDINAVLKKYHPLNALNICLLASSMGICFCPVCYTAQKFNPRVRKAVAESEVGKVLINERGVAISYYSGNRKFMVLGGLIFRLPCQVMPNGALVLSPEQLAFAQQIGGVGETQQVLAAPVGQVMGAGS